MDQRDECPAFRIEHLVEDAPSEVLEYADTLVSAHQAATRAVIALAETGELIGVIAIVDLRSSRDGQIIATRRIDGPQPGFTPPQEEP